MCPKLKNWMCLWALPCLMSEWLEENFCPRYFILFRTQQALFPQPPRWKRTSFCHVAVVFYCYFFLIPQPNRQRGKNDVGFWYTYNFWNRHFWKILIANKERGDLRFSYLLAPLRMFSVFHPVLKACHLIMTLSSLYSLVRTCQSLLRQLIMTWRFPHSSQFRELGYLWIPE